MTVKEYFYVVFTESAKLLYRTFKSRADARVTVAAASNLASAFAFRRLSSCRATYCETGVYRIYLCCCAATRVPAMQQHDGFMASSGANRGATNGYAVNTPVGDALQAPLHKHRGLPQKRRIYYRGILIGHSIWRARLLKRFAFDLSFRKGDVAARDELCPHYSCAIPCGNFKPRDGGFGARFTREYRHPCTRLQ